MGQVLDFRLKSLPASESCEAAGCSDQIAQRGANGPNQFLSATLGLNQPLADLSGSLAKLIDRLEMAVNKIDSMVDEIDQPDIRSALRSKLETARKELISARRCKMLMDNLLHG